MPGFYDSLKNSLRTVEQGADTITYLCVAKDIESKVPPASFVQDRVAVSKHLPLAWTTNQPEEDEKLWSILEKYVAKLVPSSEQQQQQQQQPPSE